MPLFYQHNINEHTKLAVWHITENEAFFLEKVAIKNEITHPHKRVQHLAGRYLLQLLDVDFPLHLISISESKKPLLTNEKFHFSISHCGAYAAAIISENKKVGIDVEIVTPKIDLVKTKFLTEAELTVAAHAEKKIDASENISDHQIHTLFWSSKEAIYKWYGNGALSFKRNMALRELSFENGEGIIGASFIKDQITELKIHFRFFGELCLAWVVK
jgi:phosphopantetheinyl transferase